MTEYEAGPVVLIDKGCPLCTFAVRFIVTHEDRPVLRFASLDSNVADRLLDNASIPGDEDTIVFIENGTAYTRSEAALRISRYLRFPWRLLWNARVVPRNARDTVYRFVARNRYRLFGRRNHSFVESVVIEDRILR